MHSCGSYFVHIPNLNIIISVGYRVKSQRGTQFRIWATTILKDHLMRGYSLNQRRLAEKGVKEVQQVLSLLAGTLESHNLVSDEGLAVLEVVNRSLMVTRGSALFLLFLKKNDLLDQKSFSGDPAVSLLMRGRGLKQQQGARGACPSDGSQ